MINNVKVIIFDWGRTLYDPETKSLFPGVLDLITDLSQKYDLVVASLAVTENAKERREKIETSGLAPNLKLILVDEKDKDKLYQDILVQLGVSPMDVALVDDRVTKGVAWGNKYGATTIWVKKGKFAEELPNDETGKPTYIIQDILELRNIFINKSR